MLLLCNKLKDILKELCMHNGKLVGPAHSDATSADSCLWTNYIITTQLHVCQRSSLCITLHCSVTVVNVVSQRYAMFVSFVYRRCLPFVNSLL